MDRIEESEKPGESSKRSSQSRLPPVLLGILAAAILFRIVTAVTDRQKTEAPAGLVRWNPPQNAARLARDAGKPILYDFTAAWCQPCHRLDAEWEDLRVAGVVNGLYVPARVVDRMREEGRNPPEIEGLQRRYSVSAFPTLVIASSDGREVAKMEGYRGRESLLRFLQEGRAKRSF